LKHSERGRQNPGQLNLTINLKPNKGHADGESYETANNSTFFNNQRHFHMKQKAIIHWFDASILNKGLTNDISSELQKERRN
jgi:hypothetical protein